MFVRATFGPMPVRSNRMNRPAATTDRMPETCTASAPKYSMNGRNSSIRIRVVMVSQPRERIVSNTSRPHAYHDAEEGAAKEGDHEFAGRPAHGEYTGEGRRDGELEADDAGSVIEQ